MYKYVVRLQSCITLVSCLLHVMTDITHQCCFNYFSITITFKICVYFRSSNKHLDRVFFTFVYVANCNILPAYLSNTLTCIQYRMYYIYPVPGFQCEFNCDVCFVFGLLNCHLFLALLCILVMLVHS